MTYLFISWILSSLFDYDSNWRNKNNPFRRPWHVFLTLIAFITQCTKLFISQTTAPLWFKTAKSHFFCQPSWGTHSKSLMYHFRYYPSIQDPCIKMLATLFNGSSIAWPFNHCSSLIYLNFIYTLSSIYLYIPYIVACLIESVIHCPSNLSCILIAGDR